MPRSRDPIVFYKVSEILEAGWTAESWFAWCRCMALARQRRACSEITYPAAILSVDKKTLCWLMGRSRWDHACPIFDAVQGMAEIVLLTDRGVVLRPSELLAPSYEPTSLLLMISKYAEIQNFKFRPGVATSLPQSRKTPPTPPVERNRAARPVRRRRGQSLDEQGQTTIDAWLAEERREAESGS